MTQSLSEFIQWYRENEAKISKGPWVSPTGDYVWDDGTGLVCSADESDSSYGQRFDNMHFIIKSRNTMPDIVAALEEAQILIKLCALSTESRTVEIECNKFLKKYFNKEVQVKSWYCHKCNVEVKSPLLRCQRCGKSYREKS